MSFTIDYAYGSNKGCVRQNNEDNLFINGFYLPEVHESLPVCSGSISSESPSFFGIFDGMGGEQAGETASYIACRELAQTVFTPSREYFQKIFFKMNDAICQFQRDHFIRYMGTTAALLGQYQGHFYLCNVGDSRIYMQKDRKLTQLSEDHSAVSPITGARLLTQHLGIDPLEFLIEPAITEQTDPAECQILLCSDGLTDMVNDARILSILLCTGSAKDIVQALLDEALFNGGKDNITIILCRISGRSSEKKADYEPG